MSIAWLSAFEKAHHTTINRQLASLSLTRIKRENNYRWCIKSQKHLLDIWSLYIVGYIMEKPRLFSRNRFFRMRLAVIVDWIEHTLSATSVVSLNGIAEHATKQIIIYRAEKLPERVVQQPPL